MPTHARRSSLSSWLAPWLAVAACGLALASPALAYEDEPKPAVDRVNGHVFAGYAYEDLSGATASGGGSTSDLPGAERRGPEVGAGLAFPIFGPLGARAEGAARLVTADYPAQGSFPGGDASGFGARAGADLFARDPDTGFIEVGYRFRWGDPAKGGIDDEIAHGVHAGVGAYIPDQGMGPIDWRATFRWMRASVEGAGFSDDVDEFSGVATSGWYLTESLRFTGGFEWALDRPAASPGARDLRGSAEVAWLLPFGRVRYLTLEARGTGGRRHDEVPAPLAAVDRAVWSVGGAVSFNFPGATSLLQLARERQ